MLILQPVYFILFLGLFHLTSATDIDECKNSTLNKCSPNADCTNTNGSFECQCQSGFDGDGKTCNDIDECKNTTLNICSPNADCTNTNGSFECHCKPGFDGDGKTCNDIDECKNSTLNKCSPNADCTNTNGSFECQCKSGFDGDGKTCNDIDECKNSTLNKCSPNADCTNTNGSFECHCKPGFDGDGKTCNDIDECKNSTLNKCSPNADCTNTNGSFECQCQSGFDGDGKTCNDIDECKNTTLNICSPNAECTNTNGSFECQCKSGFDGDGKMCNDIDECKNSTLNKCSPNADCTNTNGSFECQCKSGFDGDGKTCNDIDECKNSTLNKCSPNADCTNTNGSFECQCKSGFDGDGKTCNDIDECKNSTLNECSPNADCTNTNGSFECQCKSGFDGDGKTCNEIVLFPYSKAIDTSKKDVMYGPYNMYSDIHAFGYFFSTVYVSQNGYISLGSDPQIRAQPLSNYSFPKNVVILAPFWAQLDLSGKGKIFVDDYKICKEKDRQRLSDIGKNIKNFNAKRALVITWKDVSPYPASEFGNESLTFQAVLVSDEKQLYVMFNYESKQVHLNEEAIERQILIGYLDGRMKFVNLTTETNIYEWLKKSSEGFTGKRFLKNIGKSQENSMVCLDWFCENEKKTPSFTNDLTPCPCTMKQAERDYTFQLNNNGCYETVFARNDIMQTCCYDANWGALLRGYPDGGNTYNKSANLSIGRNHCCMDYRLCNLFYDIYPSSNCSGYEIPKEVLVWDPLVFNFATGGDSVIFYGSGEYNLINTTSLKLQARIEMKKNPGTSVILSELPVYTAFAIKFDQEKIEFGTDGSSISVTPSSTLNIIVEDQSGAKLVRTPVMQMKVILNGDGMRLNLFVPASESSTSLGLLSWNPKEGNTSEKIYTTFETWKVSSQKDSLFTYTSAKNFSTINSNNVDLKQFQEINANLTKLLQDNINFSISMCGIGERHCQLQLLLENRTTIQGAEKAQVVNQQILGNFPPVFEKMSPAILVYKNILLKVQAKDPENGNVTITLDTELNKNSYQFKQNEFDWTLNSTQLPKPTFVKFFASDPSNATALYWPEVFLCTCRNRSECQESSMNNKRRLRFPGNNKTEARMYRLPCDCEEGYTGRNCEKKVEICTPTTCYPTVHCNDSKSDHPCGPCPPGMEGDGVKCFDIDQCSKGVCDQKCEDFLGNGYKCSCRHGYILATDNRTCTDVDECQDLKNCAEVGQYCINSEGNYSCKCKPGYIEHNNSCLSLKGKTKLGGSLVFVAFPNTEQAWSESLTDNSSPSFKRLAGILEKSLLMVLPADIDVVEVTSFEKIDSQQKRKKRETNPPSVKANYEIIGTDIKLNQSEESLKKNCQSSSCSIGNFQGIPRESITLQVESICPNSPCDHISTVCVETNGYKCECRPGFEKLMSDADRCKDIDECAKNPCGSANCSNTIGSYTCVCDFGSVYDNNTQKCVDVCSNNICNKGICIRNAYSFRCSCKVGWTGEKCEKKDSESEKMKINLIIVGAVLGSICVIFLLVIIIMCCRSSSTKSDNIPQFVDNEIWGGLPRARLRDVEMNENGSRLDLTKNSNTYDCLPGIQNPAFDPDDNRVDRC